MTSLNEIKFERNIFCAPAVMSAVTGLSTLECAKAISVFTHQQPERIRGVYLRDLESAFRHLGWKATRKPEGTTLYMTIGRYINEDGIYIIMVPHHFIVIEIKNKSVYLVDNHTKSPISAANSARLSQRVFTVTKIER